jgi:hypothetical protein
VNEIEIARRALAEADAELGVSPPDWSAVMERAKLDLRRRVGRAAAIGAVGAVLLLAGGLIARAAIHDEGGTSNGSAPSGRQNGSGKSGNNGSGGSGSNGQTETGQTKGGGEHGKQPEGELPNLVVSGQYLGNDLVELVVANSSAVAAGPSQLVVTLSGRTLGSYPIPGLEPGESAPVQVKCPGSTIAAAVDPEGRLSESDEEDNTAEVECGEPATGTTGEPGTTEEEPGTTEEEPGTTEAPEAAETIK